MATLTISVPPFAPISKQVFPVYCPFYSILCILSLLSLLFRLFATSLRFIVELSKRTEDVFQSGGEIYILTFSNEDGWCFHIISTSILHIETSEYSLFVDPVEIGIKFGWGEDTEVIILNPGSSRSFSVNQRMNPIVGERNLVHMQVNYNFKIIAFMHFQ